MKKIISLTFILILIAGISSSESISQRGVIFYVSPAGKDVYSGKLPDVTAGKEDGPFATLEQARDAIRQLKKGSGLPTGGVTIYVRGGDYYLTKPFELSTEDSGSDNSPIIYRAYNNEKVMLIGGKEVTGFSAVTDPAVLRRIQEPYRAHIVQADLKKSGITDFGVLMPRGFYRPMYPAGLELFFQGRPMQLARWPNTGWTKIAAVPDGQNSGKFMYTGDRPKLWVHADDIWMHGFWTTNWADSYEKIKSIDTEKHIISTYEPHGVYGYSPGGKFYVLNLLEELDAPGEWYLDRKTGILYFWPPEPLDKGKTIVSTLNSIILINDVTDVSFKNIDASVCRGTAIVITGGSGNRIENCVLRNIGNIALNVKGGRNNGITGSEITDCGDGGILLSGGDRKTLVPANNYVINTNIHDVNRWSWTVRPEIGISGVGNRISNTLLHDAPHSAIILEGNDHVIEYNEIYHVCTETSDAGAFYMGRDFSQRGNIIRYNFFHDIGPGDTQAIYLDDFTSGTLVYGNVVSNTPRGVLIGGGRDNTVQNNIFVNCTWGAVHVDARGVRVAKNYFDGEHPILWDKLNAVNYTEPPYSVRYPELRKLASDEPKLPKGNRIVSNVFFRGKWLDLADGTDKLVTVQNNYMASESDFMDLSRPQLKKDSPAYRDGFQRIPMEKIGLLQ